MPKRWTKEKEKSFSNAGFQKKGKKKICLFFPQVRLHKKENMWNMQMRCFKLFFYLFFFFFQTTPETSTVCKDEPEENVLRILHVNDVYILDNFARFRNLCKK